MGFAVVGSKYDPRSARLFHILMSVLSRTSSPIVSTGSLRERPFEHAGHRRPDFVIPVTPWMRSQCDVYK